MTKRISRRRLRELRELRIRYADGESLDALAAELSMSAGTLRWWWRKTKLNTKIVGRYRPRRRWSVDDLRDLRVRYVSGESVATLAAEVQTSPKSLTAAWTHHGLAREIPLDGFRVHGWTMAQLRRLAERWRSGASLAALGREIGVNSETIASALDRAGLRTNEMKAKRRDEIRSRREGEAVRKAYVLRRDTTMSWRQIAETIEWPGRTGGLQSAVRRWCERNEMPRPPRRSRTGRALE